MKIVIDMNISPDLVSILKDNGFEAIHWLTIGATNAPDREIIAWAKNNNYVILTHDLDFGTILAVSQASAPSVIQIRTQNLLSFDFQTLLIRVLRQFRNELETGALITVEPNRAKVRILPINR
jgi:predicted nuclease of predicted toxin-antitoxin system